MISMLHHRLTRFVFTAALAFATAASRAGRIKVEDATIAQLQTAMAKGRSRREAHRNLPRAHRAYDKQGPAINTVITLNQRALDAARASMPNARPEKVRGPLHGIPIVLKDNTTPSTCQRPPARSSSKLDSLDDAYVVKKTA